MHDRDALLIAFLIAFSILVGQILLRLWQSGLGWTRSVFAGMRSIRSRIETILRQDLDAFDCEVEKEFESTLKARFYLKVQILAYVLVPVSVCPITAYIFDDPDGLPSSDTQSWILVFACFFTATLKMLDIDKVPCIVLDASQMLSLVLCSVAVAFSEGGWIFYLLYYGFFQIPRVLFSVGYFHVSLMIAGNLVYCCIQSFTWVVLYNSSLLYSILVEFSLGILVVGFAVSERMTLRESLTNALKMRSLTGECTALTTLLHLMCEVVVEVSDKFQFVDHFPRFATMLTLSPQRDLKDQCLMDFLQEADKERLHAAIESLKKENAPPGSLHVTFAGSNDFKVDAQILYVSSTSLSGEERYMIGIREDLERSFPHMNDCKPKEPQAARALPVGPALPVGLGATGEAEVASRPRSDILLDALDLASVPEPRPRSTGAPLTPWRPSMTAMIDRPTSIKAKQVSLLSAAMHWNVLVPPTSCCTFHVLIRDISTTASAMVALSCLPTFALQATLQCPYCGFLECGAQKHCCVCKKESLLPLRASSSSGEDCRPSEAASSSDTRNCNDDRVHVLTL